MTALQIHQTFLEPFSPNALGSGFGFNLRFNPNLDAHLPMRQSTPVPGQRQGAQVAPVQQHLRRATQTLEANLKCGPTRSAAVICVGQACKLTLWHCRGTPPVDRPTPRMRWRPSTTRHCLDEECRTGAPRPRRGRRTCTPAARCWTCQSQTRPPAPVLCPPGCGGPHCAHERPTMCLLDHHVT